MKNSTRISSTYKNKTFSLGASLLATATVFGSVNVANAATFNFSFTNENGAVSGTVEGTIELPDGDFSNQPATAVIVTSAPAGLGYTIPLDVLSGVVQIRENSFTVFGGMIDTTESVFDSWITGGAVFALNSSIFGAGSHLTHINNPNPTTFNTGVLDGDNSTLTYSSNAPVSTPEPTSVIPLIGVGVLGVASKLKKKA